MDEFTRLVQALLKRAVRFIVIGVWGANYYAVRGHLIFETRDRDLFLPLDAGNELLAWQACRDVGLSLWTGEEPLGEPQDQVLARAVVERRALVTAISAKTGGPIDLSLVMTGFSFEQAWLGRRIFRINDVEVPVASLAHIVESKRRTTGPRTGFFWRRTPTHSNNSLPRNEPRAPETLRGFSQGVA